ncbi:LPXTG cell wall anchor domain-containing protein [Bifidobacteriaceae bacterium NR002]|nr:LPXTG cell wall anchor domain-containing protein [Bifidobacteriaceae bacterium NR002]
MLPSVVASALQPTQKDIIDASSVTRKMGKGKPDQDELNMQRWGAGVINKNVQTQKFVELARRDAQLKKLREANAQSNNEDENSRKSQANNQSQEAQKSPNNSEDNEDNKVDESKQSYDGHSFGENLGPAPSTFVPDYYERLASSNSADSAAKNSADDSAKNSDDTAVKNSADDSAAIKKSSVESTVSENPTVSENSAGAAVSAPAPVQQAQPAVRPESKPAVQPAAKPESTVKPESAPTAKPESTTTPQPADVKPAAKPADTPAAKQPAQPAQPADAKPAAKPEEAKQPTNAGGVKPAEVKSAENKQPVASQPVNTENAKPASEQNTSAQPSSTHAENTNTVSDASTPRGRVRRSVESGDGASDGSSVPSTTTNATGAHNADPAHNAPTSPTTSPAAPEGNASVPSAPATPTSAESNAGSGNTANPSVGGNDNAQGQGTQGQGAGNAQGAGTGATGEDKSATPAAAGSTPASEPRSTSSNNPTSSPTSTPAADTPAAGTPNTGATNTATDPNSQVIKPNTDNPTADSTDKANKQVQTDKKPKATYNLKIRYTIGGAANKQLVQPYELTIDKDKLDSLDDADKYEYIELPKSAGYRPSVYHSGDYQYYVKKVEGANSKFVIDDGTDADAVRYLRLSKKLITDYAVKERPAVGGNNGAQAPQTSQSTNPQSSSSTQPKAEDGIQYYGELNINYAPKTAKYYVRHLVQNLKDKDTFDEAPNIGKPIVVEHKTKDKNGKVTTTKEVIHVTEITGTVGSNVTAVSTYIRGYEPEHNLISSPLSDSEDESDKLVLNLRYYRKAYEVTYDSTGGTDVTAQKVYYGQEVPEVPEPTYRGHHFLGWEIVQPGDNTNLSGDNNNRSSASNRSVTNEAHNYIMPDHDVKFRAVWEANNTTNYRVNVWVQKADLVDKEHPNSLANYDFVGLVERKNVQTDSEVALDKMNDAGVVDDASKLNGADETDYVKNPELGLTKEELQGTEANKYKDGLIEKFNWMNDTHVTNLDGYNTENPGDPNNYTVNANGERVYKDKFTRYFHVNKELTKKLNLEQHDFVPGRPDLGKRSKSQLCADDLNNTLNLVYNRKEYELIFAKPNNIEAEMGGNNAVIHKKNSKGEMISYCYAGGGDCSDKLDKESTYTYGNSSNKVTSTVDHKGYRVKVRYGQSLTDFWPNSDEVDFMDNSENSSLGFVIGGNAKGGTYGRYRDTPPFRLTKEEFVDPKFHWVYGKGVAPQISDDPADKNAPKYTVKDNQRLLILDFHDNSQRRQAAPIQVIIKKQSIASAKNGDKDKNIKYELSTDSYSKDDTSNDGYVFPPSSIAGFESKITGFKPENSNREDGVKVEHVDTDDFFGKVHDLYEEVTGEEAPEDPPEEDKDTFPDPDYTSGEEDEDGGVALKNLNDAIAERLKKDPAYKKYYEFKKKYHLEFRHYYAGVEEKLKFGSDNIPSSHGDNSWIEIDYDRKSYDVQFYNADGNAIKDGSDAATEKLPFEYSLTKRGNDKLTDDDDKALYYNDGAVKSYDASVTKDDADNKSKQFDGKYTFKLNGKTYSIVRPDNLPEDYVFKGWAVDQAGIHLINGKINDNSEGAEGDGKAKGETKDFTMPVNGIKLYAAWGKPEGIKHTVTLNYHMPEIDENGKEKSGTNVVTKQQFDHYYVIKENKDIKVPTRKGYDFYGWEIDKNGTKLPYAFGNKVVEDITLHAVWVKDTRYNGTFKHIFLKPGYTFADYKQPGLSESEKAAMVDHISTQTVSGLREHLRYNAEAVYSDETHFPDKQFTSFEASSTEDLNTGEFIYQTYNTRKYKVRYVTIGKDGKEKDLLPESEVSSVNRKYDVAFYKPIEGFMPETTQQNIKYATDEDGKQTSEDTFTFVYKDVRVLKRQDDAQIRPTNYTRYVFKVADGQDSMGSVVDWQGNNVADGSALVYDAIKGTKAYQMPLPTVKAKPGYEFDVWTSKIYIDDGHGGQTGTDGFDRLPILSESQPNPKVVYTVKFKLKAPVAIDTKVLKPTDALSLDDNSAKELIKNADKYPSDAKFSFVTGEKFDSTPGLHKIKVQVTLGNNTAETEVLYRVLPDLVYKSDWDKFKTSDYGSKNANDYVPITFTGKNDEGKLIGHDSDNADTSTGEETTLTAYVYKGKDVRIRVPQAFGKDYSNNNYHYVFKGWATKVVEPTPSTPSTGTPSTGTPSTGTPSSSTTKPEEKKQEQTFDINSSDRYKKVNLQDGVTYHAIYKRIDYFSSSSDNGTVPEDSVIAIFKPAPKRKWKDGSDGPKVFYVKKGANLADTTVKVTDSDGNTTDVKVLDFLKSKLINPTDSWSRSSMINGEEKVTPIDNVSDWHVNEPFQEFVADQKAWTQPEVHTDYLVAVQDKRDTLPSLDKYLTNLDALEEEAEAVKKDGKIVKDKYGKIVKDVKVEYDLPEGKTPEEFETEMLKKPSLYTVPLKITVNYTDGAKPETYKRIARLKVDYQMMYPESLPPKPGAGTQQPGSGTQQGDKKLVIGEADEINFVTNSEKYVKVEFEKPSEDEGTSSGRSKYYIWKASDKEIKDKTYTKGVKAPQVTGAKHDKKSFHYEFIGWEIVGDSNTSPTASTSSPAPSASPMVALYASTPNTTGAGVVNPVETGNTSKDKIYYTKDDIAKMAFTKNTKFRAAFRKVNNVLEPGTNEKIPDNYVPHLFLPGFGRRWTDGTSNPKVFYFDPESSNYYNDINNKVDNLGVELKGFGGWSIYGAAGNELTATSPDYSKKETRVYVAKQARVDDVNASDIVLSVGDGIPGPDELVHGNDANSNPNIVGVQGAGVYDINKAITKPGITTVVVNVTRTNDKKEQVIVPVKVHIRVLPKVIADKDLPEKGTKEYEFISENYTKVTYVAGEGGTMQSPMHTYWVRNGKESAIKDYIPDVLANRGYIFKNWDKVSYSKNIDTVYNSSDNHKSTDAEREALAKIAERYGRTFTANIIRKSKNSTFAAIKNILAEAMNINDRSRDARVDRLASFAEAFGKSYTAKIIRNSQKSSIEALKNLLVQAGITDSDIAMAFPETETIIVANFEKMKPMKFKLSGSAREGIFTNFRLQNMTEGDANNTTVTVDGEPLTINKLIARGLTSVNGINAICDGTECKISGTPKIVNGKPKVELKFTTTDKYGREAEVTMEIDVEQESHSVPTPTPTPTPTPEPEPEPEPDFDFDFDFDLEPDAEPDAMPDDTVPSTFVPSAASYTEPEPEPKTEEPSKPAPNNPEPTLAKTGSNVAQSAILAGLLASVGLAGFAGKHRRKRKDKES